MKTSIIIPIYNVEKYIGDCLNSVFKQTHDAIEVIMVNDCTPDNSMVVAEPFIEQLKKRYEVIVVSHEENKGLSAARNTGVKHADGDYIYFLDSDDEIAPNCIELLTNKIKEHGDVDFVMGGMQLIGVNRQRDLTAREYIDTNVEIASDFMCGKWSVAACNKLLRREFFIENNLWFEVGLLHEDMLFSFYLAMKSNSMACVYDKIYLYKIRQSGSITSERGVKNLIDLNFIIDKRCKYISDNINQLINTPLSCFIIKTVSAQLHDIINATNLETQDKRKLYNDLMNSYKQVKSINLGTKTIRVKIRQIFLSLGYTAISVLYGINRLIK